MGGAIAFSPDPSGAWLYPLGQRLFYIHVPLTWVAYLAFAAAAVSAVLVLNAGSEPAARSMRASIEIATVTGAAGLFSGLAWSYEFALFDPFADPKVLTTVVLVAVLAGLWTLAEAAPPGRRDRLVASLTIVGVASVPASYLASRLATPHPDFTRPSESLGGEMGALLAAATIGFTMLAVAFAMVRARLIQVEEAPSW